MSSVRRLIKFLHTLGAVGLMGGAGALAIIALTASAAGAEQAPFVLAMAKIGVWLIGPALVATVISGLLAMLANPAFQEAGWVWVKAATGVLILEAGLHLMGPIQEEAKRQGAPSDLESLSRLLEAEANTAWLMIAVSAANVALAIWRPRLPTYKVR